MQGQLERKGMWAIITGASSGIGESMARELARDGVNLVLVARRLDRLQTLGAELKEKHQIESLAIDADLSLPNETKRVFERATANGRMIQVLINNAGIGTYGPFMHYELEQYSKTIQLNVTALTELTYYLVGHMQAHGKKSYISNVGSIASFLSVPYFSVYGATKHFVRDFTQTLNFELRKSNISVSLIAPGGTYSEFTEHSGQVLRKSAHGSMMTSELVAQIGMDRMFKGHRSIVPGFLNSLMVHFPRFLPVKWMLACNDLVMRMAVDYKK